MRIVSRGIVGTSRTALARAMGVIVMLLFTTGCGMLSPKPDTSRYFMLRPTPAQPSAGAPLSDLVLGLGPVTLPEYLDQFEMLDLVGPYELKYSAQNRWVEPLGGQIYRTLADNLYRQLNPDAILAYPWYASDGVGLQVEVSFDPIRLDEFGAWQGGAAWVIRDPATRVTLERNASDFVLGTDTIPPQDMARRLSEELGRLATEITAGVRRQYGR